MAKLPQMLLKYKGVFDFDELYKKVIAWLQQEEFEFHEQLYKNKPPELEIKWIAKRKVTGYVQYVIKFYFYLRGVKEVEVVKNGVKKKMTQGRMELYLDSEIVTGYKDDLSKYSQWEATPFLSGLREFYDQYVIKKELDIKHEDVLYYLVFKLHNYMKEMLDMQVKGNAYQ